MSHSPFSAAPVFRSLPLLVGLLAGPRVATAQMTTPMPDRATAMEIRSRFTSDLDSLQAKFVALAEAIPEGKYSWRPAPGVRSIAETLQHISSEYYVYAPMAYGAAPSPVVGRGREAFKKFEAMSSKAEVLKHLKESFAFTRQALSGMDEAKLTGTQKLFGGDRTIVETSFRMAGDLHEHLGQLIAYARMNGVKPPWSK